MIIDVKTYNVLDQKIEDYGWTVFPLYEELEVDDDPDTQELFLNTGLYNLPLFRGPVVEGILRALLKEEYPYNYLNKCLNDPNTGLKLLEPKCCIVKCVDNQ